MEKLVIKGGTKLEGEVEISGAKNAAVAIIPATILIGGKCTLSNVPNISDVTKYIDILEELGAKVTWNSIHSVTIDTSSITSHEALSENVSKFRASYYLIGAFLARFKAANVGMPGGCNIGERPIDQHLKGFEALGANIEISDSIYAKADNLKGSKIFLDVVSVGATINVMLAAAGSNGETIIENAAKEPHIVDVANFLNTMGANIKGAGTSRIKIIGVKEFKKSGEYSIVPDQIEAGTFMIAASKNGNVLIKNCIPKHMESLTSKLREMGVTVKEGRDSIRIISGSKLSHTNISTAPYPGFPTDLQSQLGVLLSVASGQSVICENIWHSRFAYTNELNNMGANISVNGDIAIFNGVKSLNGTKVYATDLRAGAALIIAGIFADGITELYNLDHIDRGYEDIEGKFKQLGADITRVKEDD